MRLIPYLAVAALLLVAAPAEARLAFTRTCDGNFECARLKVPLDRTGTVPGTVTLSIERIRPDVRRPEGAVFALAGGPGQGASSVTEGFNSDTFGVIGKRDLIVVDQRGTGRSGALDCRELEQPSDRPIDVRTEHCAEELGAARGLYTTGDTVEDLDAVRAALGIDRITLFGVSYGTKVALTYAARYPEHVERLVLDSVVAPEGQDPFDLDSFAAMPRVFGEMCRGECGGVTRSLPADVAELADRLPLRGPVIDPSGRRVKRTVTTRDLYQQIRAGDALADLRVGYPGMIRAALDGDPAPLVRLIHGGALAAGDDQPQPGSFADVLSFTLQAATLCEEAPFPWERFASTAERDTQARTAAEALPDEAFEPFDRASVLAADSNNLLFQCRRWPTTPERTAPAQLDEMPDVPVLVLEGLEDLRTPLEIGRRVAGAFPHSTLLGVPKTGHSVLSGAPCARAALKRFMADRAVGDVCGDQRRTVRIEPVPPADLDAVAGSSKVKRTLAAVRLTLQDLRTQLAFGGRRGGGLRAGRFVQRNGSITLKRFSFVPGVTVSGGVPAFGDRRSGPLQVRGRAAARGTVRLRRGKLAGRLGGRRVRGG